VFAKNVINLLIVLLLRKTNFVISKIMATDFKQQLSEVIIPKVQKELGIENAMAAPRFSKVVLNVGIGSRYTRSKDFTDVMENLSAITGQKGTVRNSRKAISNFKLRTGMPNGVTVTLRGKRMYDFLNRLISVALPRTRDFQGVPSKSFDKRGNYSLGIKDISVFPEIQQDDLSHVHGVEITIVTTADDDAHARALLVACQFPFKKTEEVKVEQPESDESSSEKDGDDNDVADDSKKTD
jgi:large subunit ribosomal protein L5